MTRPAGTRPISRRSLVMGGSAACLAASGAGMIWPGPAAARPARLVLHEWFAGPTHAIGRFASLLDGSQRALAVDLRGRWDGKALSLFEDFFYDDGERDQKTWVYTALGDHRYTGTREDVVSPAEVFSPTPETVRFTYTADLRLPSGSTRRLNFDDTLTLRPDNTVFNRAEVAWYLLPVGNVELVFRKGRLPARYRRKGWAARA